MIVYPGFVPIRLQAFSLAQAFYAWGNGDGITGLSGPFYGPPGWPTSRTPVNGRDIAMENARLPRRKTPGLEKRNRGHRNKKGTVVVRHSLTYRWLRKQLIGEDVAEGVVGHRLNASVAERNDNNAGMDGRQHLTYRCGLGIALILGPREPIPHVRDV